MFAHLMNGDDVGVVERRRSPSFFLEPAATLGVGLEILPGLRGSCDCMECAPLTRPTRI